MKKEALVIVNGDYQNTGKLRNSVNDSRDIASFLKNVGFSVSHFSDLEQDEFWEEVENFGLELF
ncbi:hypothetical protein ThvES_00017250 [Thiovulum sp. ES]|nr:hypothetical protein ThvES_00017250 [Thiovulum sp. ES]